MVTAATIVYGRPFYLQNDVPVGGTITVDYPAGYDVEALNLVGDDNAFSIGQQVYELTNENALFGEDSVTITNDSNQAWPAAAPAFLQLSAAVASYSIPSSEYFPRDTGDGETDLAALISASWTRLAGTGRTQKFDDGDYRFGTQLPAINGFKVEMSPGAKLIATAKTGLRIRMTGENSAIIGGEIRNQTMRRYRIESITQAGGANTAVTINLLAADITELGPHDFVPGETHYNQNVVLTAGSWNGADGISLTVSSVTETSITYVARTATIDTSVTYPYDPLDGHNGRTIYPVVYRSRTTSSADACLLVTGATNAVVRGTKLRWAAGAGVFVSGSTGFDIDVDVIDTAADGIHVTNKSKRGKITGSVTGSGDDGAAVVSYFKDGGVVSGVEFLNLRIRDLLFNGRGVLLAGAHHCKVLGLDAEDIYHAGIMIYSDSTTGHHACSGNLVADFKIKTCGLKTATTPTGWEDTALPAIYMGMGGTGDQYQHRNNTIRDGVIYNARGVGIGSSSSTRVRNNLIDNVLIEETGGIGVSDFAQYNCVNKDVKIRYAQNSGIVTSTGNFGMNRWVDPLVEHFNRGTRLWLASVVATAADGGTVVFTLKPGVSHSLTGGSVIRSQRIRSSDTSNSASEVAKDYALNTQYTVASVDGQTITITGTGLAATSHAKVSEPGEACDAYISLVSGAAATNNGFEVGDFSALGGQMIVERPNIATQSYDYQYALSVHGNVRHLTQIIPPALGIAGQAAEVDSSVPFVDLGQISYSNVTSDANSVMTASALKVGLLRRSGMTAQKDYTTLTAAQIVDILRSNLGGYGVGVFRIANENGTAVAVNLVGGSGVTITGTATTAQNTMTTWQVSITDATSGSEAVTFTRLPLTTTIAA